MTTLATSYPPRPMLLSNNFCPISRFLFSDHWAAIKYSHSLFFAAAVMVVVFFAFTDAGGADAGGGAEASVGSDSGTTGE